MTYHRQDEDCDERIGKPILYEVEEGMSDAEFYALRGASSNEDITSRFKLNEEARKYKL